jgi:hypothetical protein
MYTSQLSYPSEIHDVTKSRRTGGFESASRDLLRHFEEYARDRPANVALWALGIGFVLGWKLKPW